MVFLGHFSTQDGRQFFVGAALFGQSNLGPTQNSWTLTGRAVIVENNPGPINRFKLGTFSVTGSLSQDASSGLYTFNFVLANPGPTQRTSLTPGTSFNAVFVKLTRRNTNG